MRTKFWQNYFLGKGFAETSAHLFLNLDIASGGGEVWGEILRLLLFLFWQNSNSNFFSPPPNFVFRFAKCAAKKEFVFVPPTHAHTTKTPL
ncbi:MAG: hypothetical protein COW50_02260 [Candidatus Moranbacteria bacterium CG17_big_fil_post_rev_8_21_14_2_50_41_107]|nr:MAG: hypothetical protein COW50_02260 [Candidatus Moranbacteria bacterium CG17_big_fil_post_rev_8_21_14_2_50_41_107]